MATRFRVMLLGTSVVVVAVGVIWASALVARDRSSSPGQAEERVVVRAVPQLTTEGYGEVLTIPVAGKDPIRVPYGWFGCEEPAELPAGRELTFTLWRSGERSSWRGGRTLDEVYVAYELETISDAGTFYYDARVCPLHDVRMARQEIEIYYGLPGGELIEGLEKFGGAPGFVLGGCMVMDEKTTRGYVCASCVAAYAAWATEYRARAMGR